MIPAIDPDYVIVLRFIGSAEAEKHDSKLLFTQGQWVRFLKALPTLDRILHNAYTTDANNKHRTIKGAGLILEYTFDLKSVAELPVDVRVFHILHRAVLSSHTQETLDMHIHADPRVGATARLGHTGFLNVSKWLGYLSVPEWTRTLVDLFAAQEDLTVQKFGIMGMHLVGAMQQTTSKALAERTARIDHSVGTVCRGTMLAP